MEFIKGYKIRFLDYIIEQYSAYDFNILNQDAFDYNTFIEDLNYIIKESYIESIKKHNRNIMYMKLDVLINMILNNNDKY